MATEELPQTAATAVTSADAESTSSTHANLLKKAMELKEKGNAFFRAKEYKKAIIRYSKIRACVDHDLLGCKRDVGIRGNPTAKPRSKSAAPLFSWLSHSFRQRFLFFRRYAGSRSQAASYSDEEKAELVRLDQTANGNIAQCGGFTR